MILRLIIDTDAMSGAADVLRDLRGVGFLPDDRRYGAGSLEVIRGEIDDTRVVEARRILDPNVPSVVAWLEVVRDAQAEAMRLVIQGIAERRATTLRRNQERQRPPARAGHPADLGDRAHVEREACRWGAQPDPAAVAVQVLVLAGWIELRGEGAGVQRAWLTRRGTDGAEAWADGQAVRVDPGDGRRWDLARDTDDDVAQTACAGVQRHTIGLRGRHVVFDGQSVDEFRTHAGSTPEMLRMIVHARRQGARALQEPDFQRVGFRSARELKRRLAERLFRVCGRDVLDPGQGVYALAEGIDADPTSDPPTGRGTRTA